VIRPNNNSTEEMARGGGGAENLQVLSALDAAKTQWYHFTAVVIAGMGFFTDAYDLFCISLATKLLGRIYYYRQGAADPGSLPPNVAAAVNGVAFCETRSSSSPPAACSAPSSSRSQRASRWRSCRERTTTRRRRWHTQEQYPV
jgi:hypothetical protein